MLSISRRLNLRNRTLRLFKMSLITVAANRVMPITIAVITRASNDKF